MTPSRRPFGGSPSTLTRAAVLGISLATLCAPVASHWGRELGALRNWQYVLAPLFLGAIARTRSSDGAPHVSVGVRNFFFGSLAWWMLAGEALNFAAMQVSGFDFSVFDWMLENTLRGRFMWSPIYGLNHFGVHQMWPMVALVPIHALLRFPFGLCLVNVALLMSAAVVLWHLARRLVDDDLCAALAVLAFATNPWVGRLLSQGFRGESFFPLSIFLFVTAWVQRRPLFVGVATLFLCSVKEDAPFYVLGFAVAAAFRRGRSRAGAVGLALLASATLALDLLVIRPAALESSGANQPGYVAVWGGYGASLSAIAFSVLRSPARALKDVLTSGWPRLLGPSLLLPLLSPECVGAMLPGFVMLGLAGFPLMRAFVGYHPVPLVCAALCGMLVVGRTYASHPWMPALVRGALLLFPLVGGGYFRITWPQAEQLHGLTEVRAALDHRTAPICVQPILFPQLGYPADLRPLDGACQQLLGSVSVVNTELDPWPQSRDELERELSVARREGRSSEFIGGFALIRGATASGPGLR
jgi:hypothetical protein